MLLYGVGIGPLHLGDPLSADIERSQTGQGLQKTSELLEAIVKSSVADLDCLAPGQRPESFRHVILGRHDGPANEDGNNRGICSQGRQNLFGDHVFLVSRARLQTGEPMWADDADEHIAVRNRLLDSCRKSAPGWIS